MTTVEPPPNVSLVYDFERVGGETVTESTPKKSVADTFQQLLTRTAGEVEGIGDNAIYVGTQNSAYFRVDCPEMLEFIINYFDKRDEASTIVVRPVARNSPNTSPLRHNPGLRSQSSPGSPPRKNTVDPFTLDNIDELVPSQVVKLSDGKVRISVDASQLVGYLQNARMDGKSAFDVTVNAVDQKGETMTIDFASHELWFSCLCRGHEEAVQFRKLFMEGTKAVELHNDALQDLREDHPDLWFKVLFFARDLLRLGDDIRGGPAERLDAVQIDPAQRYFFSTVYFGDGLDRILDIPGPTGPTLRATLEHVFSNTEGGVVCSSHTLFPLVERFFRIGKIWNQRKFKEKYADFEKAWGKQKKKAARR